MIDILLLIFFSRVSGTQYQPFRTQKCQRIATPEQYTPLDMLQ